MIIGVGTDIIETVRVEKAMSRKSFVNKLFNATEQDYINSKLSTTAKAETAAGIFALKEAVVKAFGAGFGEIPPLYIETRRDQSGRPQAAVKGRPARIHASISHSGGFALAFAVIENE